MKNRSLAIFATVLSAATCFAFPLAAQAAPQALPSPSPDGCYPFFTTAEGCNALHFLTTGQGNTGVGWYSLYGDTTGNFNTGVGGGALALNNADSNTAVGAAALLLNTTGGLNTAVGTDALVHNIAGDSNTAVGAFALFSENATGGFPNGVSNNAIGRQALTSNLTGSFNQAIGVNALFSLTGGSGNVAIGDDAGTNYTSTESGNILLGSSGHLGENNTIRIGDGFASGGIVISDGTIPLSQAFTIASGLAGGGIQFLELVGFSTISIEAGLSQTTGASTCLVGGIFNQTPPAGSHFVTIGPNNQLADASLSSRRFKKDIAPIDKISEGILALKPVTFHWKNDNTNEPEFGLVAEDVAEVNLDWITRDPQGEISGVRYDTIPILLLNEFLKEHKKVEEQQANIAELKSTVAQQQKGMEVLTAQLKEQAAQIQKVSAQLEASKPAPKVVANKP